MKRLAVIIGQYLLSLTFIFSGIVKCIDPIGTSIKLHDYFAVMNLLWLNDWTLLTAWLLCLGELVIGLNIAFGRNRRVFSIVAFAVMLVFTPLTLYLAIENPVNECGCFGDAVLLTNWQTFGKNMLLLVASLLVMFYQKLCYEPTHKDFFSIIFYYEIVIAVVLCYLGTNRLPVIDFRPYRPGVNILESMQTTSTGEESTYVCVYEKEGERREFTLEALPEEDSGWNFVETKEISANGSVVKNEEPEIKDFFLFDAENNDFTESILTDENYTFFLISPSLESAQEKYLDRIENLYEYAMTEGYNFYCLTLNDSVKVNKWKYQTGAEYDFYYSDATILETMIRSNPGVMLIRNGTILWKTCLHDFDVDGLTSAKLSEQSYGEIVSDNKKNKIIWLLVLMLAPIFLYLPIEKTVLYYKSKKVKPINNLEQ